MGKVLAVLGLIFAIFVGVIAMTLIGFHNQETTLRTTFEAKKDANRADLDNTLKTISQVAQVSDAAKEGFKEVFAAYAEARSTGSGDGDASLMKWTQEAVPGGTFDMTLYSKVQQVVEAQRLTWTTRQKEAVDIRREHTTLLRTFPGALYNLVLGREELRDFTVTSTRTEKAFETGVDDDTKLY